MVGTIKTPLQLHGGYMALFFFHYFIVLPFLHFFAFLSTTGLYHDTCHFCKQLVVDWIKAAVSLGLSGRKQMIKYAKINE